MKRLLYYEILQFQPENIQLLERHFSVRSLPNPEFDRPALLEDIEVAYAPLGYFFGRAKIDVMPALKVIASNTTGTPHIDTDYAEKKGIRVISLKGQTGFLTSITATAELTWGLLLSVVRRIPWAFEAVCDGTWNRRLFGGKAMLSSISLGVVGLGRLGRMVSEYGISFGMQVQYFDPLGHPPRGNPKRAESLEELVATSDVVTIHVPLEEGTYRLIDRRLFSHFKMGSYLINTSRGEIVDSDALLECLRSGRLSGAALDVMEGEFEPAFSSQLKDHPLVEYARNHDNLLITPHIGGSTIDAWRRTEEYTIHLVIGSLSGA